LLLSDELLTLPTVVRELVDSQRSTEAQVAALVEAQQRTEERLSRQETTVQHLIEGQQRLTEGQQRLTEQVQTLAEAQQHTEERLSGAEERLSRLETTVQHLTEQVQALTEMQHRAEERLSGVEERLSRLEATVQRLTEQVQTLTEQVKALTTEQKRLTDTVGEIQERTLEMEYRQKVGVYFGRVIRRPQVVDLAEHVETLKGQLDAGEVDEVFLLDMVVCGPLRRAPGIGEVWLAMEISALVEVYDVERAVRRAARLRQAGYTENAKR
jgi:DNA repair exonuclease SbcCD ATPase subunit